MIDGSDRNDNKKQKKKKPQKEFKTFIFRSLPHRLHSEWKSRAAINGVTMEEFAFDSLREAIRREEIRDKKIREEERFQRENPDSTFGDRTI